MQRPVYTYESGNVLEEYGAVSFGETLEATLKYQYSPLYDTIFNAFDGDATLDPDFDFAGAVKGREGMARYLIGAKNQEHFDYLLGNVEKNMENRQVLQRSTILQSLGAGLLDPMNIAFPIPILRSVGGLVKGTMTAGQAFKAGAVGGATVGIASEAMRAPFDPLATKGEVAANIAMNTVGGGVLGTIPSVARAIGRNVQTSAKVADRNLEVMMTRGTALRDEVDGVKLDYDIELDERSIGVEFKKDTVFIDKSLVKEQFYKKPWTKPEVEGAKPLAQGDIPSEVEYASFLIHREIARKGGAPTDKKKLVAWIDGTNKEALQKMTSGYGEVKTLVTDNPLYNMIGSPLKRTRNSEIIPEFYKMRHARIAENNAVTLERHVEGLGVESMETSLNQYKNQANQLVIDLEDLQVMEATGDSQAPDIFGTRDDLITRAVAGTRSSNEEFEAMLKLRAEIANPAFNRTLTDYEKKYVGRINSYYDDMLAKAKDVDFLTDVINIPSEIKNLKEFINKFEKSLADGSLDPNSRAGTLAQARININKKELAKLEGMPKFKQKQNYLNRVPRSQELANDNALYERFVQVIMKYQKGEKTVWDDAAGKWVEVSPRERAEQIADAYAHPQDFDPSTMGRPAGPRFFQERTLGDIPDYELIDFIHTDPSIVHDYARKVGLAIEYRKSFGDQTFDEFLEEFEIDAVQRGLSDDDISAYKRDITADFDALRGLSISDPSKLTTRIANFLRNVAQVTYLGKAAEATFGDLHGVIGQHGARELLTAFNNPATRATKNLIKEENRELVEALNLIKNDTANKVVIENTRMGEVYREEKIMNALVQRFHNLPLFGSFLGPMTKLWRGLDGVLRHHRIIKHAIEMRDGTIDPKDKIFLGRMGITEEIAKDIANIKMANGESPFQGKATGDGSLYFANIAEWPTHNKKSRELKRAFVNALETGIHNTVVIASLADKPIIVRGAAYVPYKPFMGKLGFEPDARVSFGGKKVVKISDGTLTAPFVFMSFGLGALPRITARLADPFQKHRMTQVLSAAMLGFLVLRIRKSDWWFENNDMQDIVARSFDYAGIAGIYGDIFYTSLEMLAGAGVLDEETMLIKPKYYNIDGSDALTAPLGAPAGMVHGWIKAANKFVNGETDEATREFARNFIKILNTPVQYDFADLAEDVGLIEEYR